MITNARLAWAILAASLAFAISPVFVSFDGFDADAFPNPQIDPPGQPAGYAFAIWGVIYLWLIVSAGFGALRHADDPAWGPARPALLVSLGVGAIWLPVAEASPVWALVLIWVMLISALVALARTPLSTPWIYRAPVGLYAGWLAAASWVSVALNGAGFSIAFDALTWAYLIVLAATVTAAIVLMRVPKIPTFAIAVAWALVAVVVQNLNTQSGLATLAGGCALIVAALALRQTRMGKPE